MYKSDKSKSVVRKRYIRSTNIQKIERKYLKLSIGEPNIVNCARMGNRIDWGCFIYIERSTPELFWQSAVWRIKEIMNHYNDYPKMRVSIPILMTS